MELTINKKYLWIPFKAEEATEMYNLEAFCKEEKIQEINVRYTENFDFYGFLDVEKYLNETITIKGDLPQSFFDNLKLCDTIPQDNNAHNRARIHLTAHTGWLNDPNGLVYHNGLYHFYYQHNPYGTTWQNMHWGYAVSDNLVDWKEQPEAMYPDNTGTMFSGCGLVDEKNLLGYGKDALLFYYTAAGCQNNWAGDLEFTQRLAYSVDDGKTLIKSDKFLMDTIAQENRDPKIFWHEESKAYVMALFIKDFDFSIFRSTDLINWEKSDDITMDGMWECPDLYELAVDGDENNKMWVFWSADGYYVLGDFDGYKFTVKTERLLAYASKLPYATQTYSNTGDRVIAMAWLRAANAGKRYTGLMALPEEMKLVTTKNGVRLSFNPVEEVNALITEENDYTNLDKNSYALQGNAAMIKAEFAQATGMIEYDIMGEKLVIDFDNNKVQFNSDCPEVDFEDVVDLTVFIDFDVIEVIMNKGTFYMVSQNHFENLDGDIKITANNTKINSMQINKLRDMK